MMRKSKALQLLGGLAVITAVGAMLVPANAQFFDRRYQPQRERGGGFFDGLFGGGGGRQRQEDREIYREAPAQQDFSRAPAPRKEKPGDIEPTTSIVVLGDSMADWLASGLEDAFGDAPEIGVVRKNKQYSGLLRYDARNDLDWWHVARDLLASEKPSYVVMMIGVADRQNLRGSDVAKEAEQQAKESKDQAAANQANAQPGAAPQDQAKQDQQKKETDDEGGLVAPEPKAAPAPRRAASAGSGAEFRTDAWEKIYTRRIDDTINALKSKGVPVIWVGLPPIRGAKSTADTGYLNDLYRARAERAGAIYVDVWDGFVDDEGRFTTSGPDYEGQVRRLRSGDGVYFTKFGARKLAHYVEREVRRLMQNRGPIALPMGPTGPVLQDSRPTARPLAGPVVPLTTLSGGNDELLGGSSAGAARADASASAVLVKGDAVAVAPGRADDFVWPPGSERPKVEPKLETPVAAPATPPAAAPQAAAVAPAPVAPAPAAPVAVAPPAPAPTAIMKPEPAPQPKPETRPAQATVEPAARTAPQPQQQQRAVVRPQQQPILVDPRDPRLQQQQQRSQQQPPRYADPRERPPPGYVQQQQQRRRDDGGLFGIFR